MIDGWYMFIWFFLSTEASIILVFSGPDATNGCRTGQSLQGAQPAEDGLRIGW